MTPTTYNVFHVYFVWPICWWRWFEIDYCRLGSGTHIEIESYRGTSRNRSMQSRYSVELGFHMDSNDPQTPALAVASGSYCTSTKI